MKIIKIVPADEARKEEERVRREMDNLLNRRMAKLGTYSKDEVLAMVAAYDAARGEL